MNRVVQIRAVSCTKELSMKGVRRVEQATAALSLLVSVAVVQAAAPAQPHAAIKHLPFEFQTVARMSEATGKAMREGLVVGKDGLLYGTAPFGGESQAGTFFRFNPSTGQVTVLHHFSWSETDGGTPMGKLWLNEDGSFLGVTATGGSNFAGVIYRITPEGHFEIIKSFGEAGPLGPRAANAGVIQATDGRLYGTTSSGGYANNGTLYRLNPDGSGFEVLHEFDQRRGDGQAPAAELIQGKDGDLYGMTTVGGRGSPNLPGGLGTIFRWRMNGKYELLQELDPMLGGYPLGPLLLASDGFMYGSNGSGGPNADPNRWGDVFRLGTHGRRATYKVVMVTGDIAGDSASLASGLIETPDGYLWGTAYWGGACVERGTVYRTSKTGDKRVIHSFCTADGGNPSSELVLAPDGWLYGTTEQAGGQDWGGTIFRVWPHDH
jgi:uncharacterized repeat protein (TIGR03803 family)